MSHASVVVALNPKRVEQVGVEVAVQEQMFPFDENDECFREGSRWDWYVVGGRFTGKFDGYDPVADPENREVCDLCAGTGKRPDMQVVDGCNGCHGKGVHTKWPTQWKEYQGDISTAGQVKRLGKFTGSYAFLSNLHWHEPERLGWFGCSARTECELKHPDNPDAVFGKCLHKDETTGAQIVCWNEPFEIWEQKFIKRFLEPLPDDAVLVNVDYHV